MDVERTIQFLLEHQAAAETRHAAAAARHHTEIAELRALVKENTVQINKLGRRLDACGKLVTTGMKMLVKTNQKIDLLTRKVDRLTDSLRNSRNGGSR